MDIINSHILIFIMTLQHNIVKENRFTLNLFTLVSQFEFQFSAITTGCHSFIFICVCAPSLNLNNYEKPAEDLLMTTTKERNMLARIQYFYVNSKEIRTIFKQFCYRKVIFHHHYLPYRHHFGSSSEFPSLFKCLF